MPAGNLGVHREQERRNEEGDTMKKLSRKDIETIHRLLIFLMTILIIVANITVSSEYYIGLHNIDLSHNVQNWIEVSKANITYSQVYDEFMVGQVKPLKDFYISSLDRLTKLWIYMAILSMFKGAIIFELVGRMKI
jgi:cell division protein FtsL